LSRTWTGREKIIIAFNTTALLGRKRTTMEELATFQASAAV
jgi:hypothetical protein